MSEKLPLVLFSGGLDSTYMLDQALELGDVHTCYMDSLQSKHKKKKELAARKEIIKYLTTKHNHRVVSDTVVDMSLFSATRVTCEKVGEDFVVQDIYNTQPNVSWGQAGLWITGLLFVVNGYKHSEVQIGNVMGDDIALHLGDQWLAWNHLNRFSKHLQVPLRFPLQTTSKDTIIEEFDGYVQSLVWVCELPVEDKTTQEISACNECHACMTMRKTIFQWEYFRKRDYKEWIAACVDIYHNRLQNKDLKSAKLTTEGIKSACDSAAN